MSRLIRFRFLPGLICALLVLGLPILVADVFSFSFSAETPAEHEAWLKSTASISDPAQLLEEISTRSIADRRAVYGLIPNERKSSLWRTHLEQRIAADPTLTEPQRVFLEEVLGTLNDELFMLPVEGAQAKVKQICNRAAEILGPDQKLWLGNLGAPIPKPSQVAIAYRDVVRFLRKNFVLSAGKQDICNCSVGSICQCSGDCWYGCVVLYEPQCGCFWLFVCDGTCGVI